MGMNIAGSKLAAGVLAGVFGAMTCAVAQTAATAAPPEKDVVIFQNGDQLSGKLVRGVGGDIVFKSDMAGEITVSLEKVKELRSTGKFALLRKGAGISHTPVRAETIVFADGSVTLGDAAERVPVSQIGYLIDQATYDREMAHRAGALSGWQGGVSGGATLVRSTTDVNTFTAGVTLVRMIPSVPYLPARNRTSLNLQETYGKQTSPGATPSAAQVVVKTNIFHVDAERDEYVSPRFYVLGQTSFDHNYAQGLALQAVYGVGIGRTLVKGARQQLDVKADVHYESQKFLSMTEGATPAPSLNLMGSTFSEAYRRTLPRGMQFTEVANVLPAWNNSSAYSANGSAVLAIPVFKRLGAQIAATDNFINDPPAGFQKNSFQFAGGVTYSLR
jgi:hypothetical protein